MFTGVCFTESAAVPPSTATLSASCTIHTLLRDHVMCLYNRNIRRPETLLEQAP